MRKKRVMVAGLIVIVCVFFSGFAYAHVDKLNAFNQTKIYFESLGFDVYILTFSLPAFHAISPILNVASFITIARQNNATTIDSIGYHFYLFTAITAYEYTPRSPIWLI